MLFVLSAPSGAGKTTVVNRLVEKVKGLKKSVSHTTRGIRKNETGGVDYHFVDRNEFEAMADRGDFVESAIVYGEYYGTSLSNINQNLDNVDEDILLEIDTQGASALKDRGIECLTIFMMPPSMEELEKRIVMRGTESAASVKERLQSAIKEMEQKDNYDYVVVNDDLDRTVEQIAQIIVSGRLKAKKK